MTLTDARAKTIAAINSALSSCRPKVKVSPYNGSFSISEVKKLYTSTPRVLVSPLASGKDGVKLAAYLLVKSTDKNVLGTVDSITSAIRHLPGPDRPLLDVAARSLYDKESGAIGANLWGFAALWPHLSTGAISGVSGGPITIELQNMKAKINALFPEAEIGCTEAERSSLKIEGEPPFVLIIPRAGNFITKTAGQTKYSDTENKLWARNITGAFEIPVEIECWGRDEAEAESLGTGIIPILPYSSTEAGLNKKVRIVKASPASHDSGVQIFTVGLEYSVQIGTTPEIVPVFKSSTAAPE